MTSHISPVSYVPCNWGRVYYHQPATNPDSVTFTEKFLSRISRSAVALANTKSTRQSSVKKRFNNLHVLFTGRVAESFWKLPSRRAHPDYYKEIKNPVSLTQIKNKIIRGSYGTLSEVAGDMNIVFENAKQYNAPSSRLYKDAVKLQR